MKNLKSTTWLALAICVGVLFVYTVNLNCRPDHKIVDEYSSQIFLIIIILLIMPEVEEISFLNFGLKRKIQAIQEDVYRREVVKVDNELYFIDTKGKYHLIDSITAIAFESHKGILTIGRKELDGLYREGGSIESVLEFVRNVQKSKLPLSGFEERLLNNEGDLFLKLNGNKIWLSMGRLYALGLAEIFHDKKYQYKWEDMEPARKTFMKTETQKPDFW